MFNVLQCFLGEGTDAAFTLSYSVPPIPHIFSLTFQAPLYVFLHVLQCFGERRQDLGEISETFQQERVKLLREREREIEIDSTIIEVFHYFN